MNVDINLGKACNNRCLFCSNGRTTAAERRWARRDAVLAEIARRRSEGADSIGFLGGEPTLYPHLEDLIQQAREAGYQRISLCTNGSRLADGQRLERLLRVGLTRVALSIHSHQANVEDRITGRKGSLAEKLAAVDNLVAAKRRGRLPDGLSLNTVLHGKNVDRLEDFTAAMVERGVVDIRFNFIRPSHRAARSKVWVPRFKLATAAVMGLVVRNEREFGIRLNFGDFPLCKLPWKVLAEPRLRRSYIGENWDTVTDVTEMRRRPNRDAATGEQIRFNWRARRMEFKTTLPGCAACQLAASCEGVWQAYLDIHGAGEFAAGPAVIEASLARAGGRT